MKTFLNERLVELKYESHQEVYYIDKAIIRITINVKPQSFALYKL